MRRVARSLDRGYISWSKTGKTGTASTGGAQGGLTGTGAAAVGAAMIGGPTGTTLAHVVEPGENLFRIGLRYSTSVGAIMQLDVELHAPDA